MLELGIGKNECKELLLLSSAHLHRRCSEQKCSLLSHSDTVQSYAYYDTFAAVRQQAKLLISLAARAFVLDISLGVVLLMELLMLFRVVRLWRSKHIVSELCGGGARSNLERASHDGSHIWHLSVRCVCHSAVVCSPVLGCCIGTMSTLR